MIGNNSQKLRVATIEVLTTDARRFEVTIEAKDIPFTPEQVEEKFIGLVSPVLGKEKASKVIETVKHLESLENVADLAGLLLT